jgi:hypothetical protein
VTDGAIELTKQFLNVAGDGECELRQLFEAGQSTQAQPQVGGASARFREGLAAGN